MVTEHSAIQHQADEFALSLGEREPRVRTLATAYYIGMGLADTPKAAALLREYEAKGEKELDGFQKQTLTLLRARVFDYLIETGHMDRFKASIGL